MLNRIRRAVSLTRARYAPKGRHRRPLRPSRPLAVSPFLKCADASTVALSGAFVTANHRHPLAGEDNALVRPYVLAWEERVRPRVVVAASHLPAEAWSYLVRVR